MINAEKKKIYDAQLRESLKVSKNINSETVNVKEMNQSSRVYSYDKGAEQFNSVYKRIVLSIVLSVCFGLLTSYFIKEFLDDDGSWSYILYTIYGTLLGTIIGKVSGVNTQGMAMISAVLSVICMVLPYYFEIYEILPVFYKNLTVLSRFAKATKEIIEIFLGSGFIRLMFVILTPVAASTAVEG